MPDHEDNLGGETFCGEGQHDPAEQSLGDEATMGGDTASHFGYNCMAVLLPMILMLIS